MEEGAPQNGCFFIRFVTFNSTLVYSVVWNQSQNGFNITRIHADTEFKTLQEYMYDLGISLNCVSK